MSEDKEAIKQHAPGSFDYARQQINTELGDRYWCRELFPKTAIVENMHEGSLWEYPWKFTDNGKDVELGAPKEVTIAYVAKAEAAERGPELTGPIVRKDALRHIAYAAVLVPGEPDSDGEMVTAAKIEEVAHGWMESYGNLDLQHTLNNVDAAPVESYITPADQEVSIGAKTATLPAGSWILAAKVNDHKVWEAIEKQKLTGWSVMGVAKATLTASLKSEGDLDGAAFKRTLLRDLGPDWVATHVSFVDEPAVPKAKFFALKMRDQESHPGLKERLMALFSKEDDMNKDETQALFDESTKALKTELADELVKAIPDAVKTAIEESNAPLIERISKLEGAGTKADGEGGDTKPDDKPDADDATGKGKDKGEAETDTVEALKEKVAGLETFKTEVEKRLDPAASRAVKGQDGDGSKGDEAIEFGAGELERDDFGRARKRKSA